MPLGITAAAVATVIAGGAGAAASIYGAHASNSASEKNVAEQIAAQNQANSVTQEANKEALQLQHDQIAYQNETARLKNQTDQSNYLAAQQREAPYVNAGNAAFAKLGDLKGLSGLRLTGNPAALPAVAPAAPLAAPGGLSSVATAQPTPQSPAPQTGAQPLTSSTGTQGVKMQAPNGETKIVPFDQVAHYLAQGALRVQ